MAMYSWQICVAKYTRQNLRGKFTSRGRNEFGIALSSPLRRKKVVISAFLCIGILAANSRPGLVNGALTFLLIKKLAYLIVDMVLFVSQDASIRRWFGVPQFRLLVRDTEVLRYAQEIALGYFDAIVTAAIRRALGTVIQHAQCA